MIDFRLVALKGAVEHADEGAYFGSLLGLREHVAGAVAAGWLAEDGQPTNAGRAEYARLGLDRLPRSGRAYLWPDRTGLEEVIEMSSDSRGNTETDTLPWPMVWWWRARLPERKGQRCRVLARGAMNTILVEFEDGERVYTSRYAVRKARQP